MIKYEHDIPGACLILDLQKSGNSTAEYFVGLKDKVENFASEQELSDFIAGIIKIGAIAQYEQFFTKARKTINLAA